MSDFRVLFFSNWFSNPYKTLLKECLSEKNIYVEERRLNQFFLIDALLHGNLNIVHFHALPIPLTWNNHFAQSFKFLVFAAQIYILKFFGVRIVWTIHEWDNKNSYRKIHFNSLYSKYFGSCFDAFITHCETSKETLIKEFGTECRDKVSVIYHGNYMTIYKNQTSLEAAREQLNIPSNTVVFLMFGGIYRYKGILETIDAFQQTVHEQASLLIVGKSHSEELEKEILDKIQDSQNIRFVRERVEDDEVQLYMNASDCVVLPYRVFTTSGVAVLAMSFGKVCIAPRIGFFDDILDDLGTFFYEPDDNNGLHKAMKMALQSKAKLPSMGRHNFELAEQWNWSYVAEKTLDAYLS